MDTSDNGSAIESPSSVLEYDSSAWTGRHPPKLAKLIRPNEHRPVLDLDPRSLTDAEPDLFGQKSAVEILHDIALNALGVGTEPPRRRSVTVALYGQYGQGKSTIFSTLRSKLENRRAGKNLITIGEFNVAEFKPDDLLYGFDRLVSEWTFWVRAIFFFVMPMPFLSYFAFVEWHKTNSFPVFTSFTGAVIALVSIFSLTKPFISGFLNGHGAMWDRISASLRLWDVAELTATAKSLFEGRPDILFVDNLDRASLDQQRAFLRTIHRFRGRPVLPPVIIVAFDSTALALGGSSPEMPAELLSKTFDTAVRLYPMTTDDVARVVLSLIDEIELEAARREHASEGTVDIARFFQYPSVCGDLARILFAHRRHSIRYCRQFMNQLVLSWAAFTSTDQSGLRLHPSDFSALMRLEGLFGMLPWIRQDPSALADMMGDDDTETLLAYAAGVRGIKQLPFDQIEAVKRYMASTRHMHPYLSDWREFTGRVSGRAAETRTDRNSTGGDTGIPRFQRIAGKIHPFIRDWVQADLQFCDESDPLTRENKYRRALANGGKEVGFSSGSGVAGENSPFADVQVSICFGYLIHRLWHGDTEAARFSAMRNQWSESAATNLLFGHEWTSRFTRSDGSDDAEILSPAQTSAFLQLLRPTPVDILGLFKAVVAAAAITDANIKLREGDRFRGKDLHGQHRKSGPLPTLFGVAVNPIPRYAVALDALGDVPPARSVDEIDWRRLEQRADIFGRLERAGCSGAVEMLRPDMEKYAKVCCRSPEAMARLLAVADKALPRYGQCLDGAWSTILFNPFAEIFLTEGGSPEREVMLGTLGLCENHSSAANLLLLGCYFAGPGAEDRRDVDPIFIHALAELALTQTNTLTMPYSYITVLAELSEELLRMRRLLPEALIQFLRSFKSDPHDPFQADVAERIAGLLRYANGSANENLT